MTVCRPGYRAVRRRGGADEPCERLRSRPRGSAGVRGGTNCVGLASRPRRARRGRSAGDDVLRLLKNDDWLDPLVRPTFTRVEMRRQRNRYCSPAPSGQYCGCIAKIPSRRCACSRRLQASSIPLWSQTIAGHPIAQPRRGGPLADRCPAVVKSPPSIDAFSIT
jgi:hypothetical protein